MQPHMIWLIRCQLVKNQRALTRTMQVVIRSWYFVSAKGTAYKLLNTVFWNLFCFLSLQPVAKLNRAIVDKIENNWNLTLVYSTIQSRTSELQHSLTLTIINFKTWRKSGKNIFLSQFWRVLAPNNSDITFKNVTCCMSQEAVFGTKMAYLWPVYFNAYYLQVKNAIIIGTSNISCSNCITFLK